AARPVVAGGLEIGLDRVPRPLIGPVLSRLRLFGHPEGGLKAGVGVLLLLPVVLAGATFLVLLRLLIGLLELLGGGFLRRRHLVVGLLLGLLGLLGGFLRLVRLFLSLLLRLLLLGGFFLGLLLRVAAGRR